MDRKLMDAAELPDELQDDVNRTMDLWEWFSDSHLIPHLRNIGIKRARMTVIPWMAKVLCAMYNDVPDKELFEGLQANYDRAKAALEKHLREQDEPEIPMS